MELKTSYVTLHGKLVGIIWPNRDEWRWSNRLIATSGEDADDDDDWNGNYQKYQYYSQAEFALLRHNMDSEGVPYHFVHIGDKNTDLIGIVYKALNDLWYWVLDSRFNGEPLLSSEGLPSKRVAKTNLREAHWKLHQEGMPSASRVYYKGKTIGYVFAVQDRMPAGWLWRHYANDEIGTSSYVTENGAQEALLQAHRSYLARKAALIPEQPQTGTTFHEVLNRYLDVRETLAGQAATERFGSPLAKEFIDLGEQLDRLTAKPPTGRTLC